VRFLSLSRLESDFSSRRLRTKCVAGFKAYEVEDEVTKDLAEFSLANAIFAALVEGHACEQSARSVVPPLFFFVRF
jgi:F0F1-type ATP synthase gamma subunit